jgi:hypothetical protein
VTGCQPREAEQRCTECGFLFSSVTPANASAAVARIGIWYAEAMQSAAQNERLRRRPSPDVWSALEYATHVRDVLLLFTRRILAILSTDEPELEVVSHDHLVAAGGYNRLDPGQVAAAIHDAAQRLASILQALAPVEFARRGFRDGQQRTILEIAQRAAHESQHHLFDIARELGD